MTNFKIKGYVARNRGDTRDISNMSFYNSLSEAKRCWGNRQVIQAVEINFLEEAEK